MTRIHRAAAEGFARAVADYERGRPGYPPEAVAVLVDALGLGRGARVVDVGAGSGKLTRELAATGADVIAVEPVAEMRTALAVALPQVAVLEGTAEALPLPDASATAITVAQAFHWFDGERALAEMHRVLRPRGRLGLIWNKRDLDAPLGAAITRVIEPYRREAPSHASLAWKQAFARTSLFTALEERQIPWKHELDAERLVARVASISFIAALPDGERRRVEDEVRALVVPDRLVTMPYVTHLYWAERR